MTGITEGYGIISEIFPNRTISLNKNISMVANLEELEEIVNYNPFSGERIYETNRVLFIPRISMELLKKIIQNQYSIYLKKFPFGKPKDFFNKYYYNDSYWMWEFFRSLTFNEPQFLTETTHYDFYFTDDGKNVRSTNYIGLEKEKNYSVDENYHFHWTFLKEYESILSGFKHGLNFKSTDWILEKDSNPKRINEPIGRVLVGKLFLTGEAEKEYYILKSWRKVAEKFNLKSFSGQFSATYKRDVGFNENDVFQTHQKLILNYCDKEKVKILKQYYIRQ